ncbi:hypothetical protein CENSYa_1591 [Cenarchaeum symbiosum A]|uniref:Uncharacterized protein n=1 Tax=Cenarchaeum symbiosum (strain A) TaxID=414004 RepID=A0RXZ4_CENSY|nr:hypothetical protein CENSYa_1591 [Cenarchaeum symbiosum A]
MQTEGAKEERVAVFLCTNCFFYTGARDDPRMSIEFDNLGSERVLLMYCKHCNGPNPHRALMASKSDYEKVVEDQLKSKK